MAKFFVCQMRRFVRVVAGSAPVERLLIVFIPLVLLCAVQPPQVHSQAVPNAEPFEGDSLRIGRRVGRGTGLVVQKAHCVAATSCTLQMPVQPGDMVVVVDALPPSTSSEVSDEQGDTFYQIYTTGWGGFGDPAPMWYATGVFGGKVTVELTAQALDIFVAEYPPAALDQVSQQAFLCCQPSATVGPLTVSNPNNLLITWVIFGTNATIPASSGFTMEDVGTSIAVEDARMAAGTYSASIPQVPTAPWGARMVSFKLLGPEFSKYKAPYSPIQVKTCPRSNGGNGFVLSCEFDAPVQQGNMLVVVDTLGCTASGCNSVSDSQGSKWNVALVVQGSNGTPLWYAEANGGPDTIYFAPGTGIFAIIAEYPPSLGLEDANFGTYDDPVFHMPNGDQTQWDVTRAILTTSPCDLLIAWGLSGTGNLDAEPGVGFTVRAYYDFENLALEDSTSGPPGAYMGSIFWNGFAHWSMGVAAFNMGGCK